jgi:hypothetical protein
MINGPFESSKILIIRGLCVCLFSLNISLFRLKMEPNDDKSARQIDNDPLNIEIKR